MINTIIFSKDRGCQLELLLRSIKIYFYEWRMIKFKILYTYSNEEYQKGYEKTMHCHPEFEYIKEIPGKFKDQVISFIDPLNQATMFFVDDMVFKDNFLLKSEPIRRFMSDKNILCVSLRLCPRVNYCYTEKRDTPPPRFTNDLMWFWRGMKGDWGYPMSIDACIFRTEEIFPLACNLKYENPNTFEGMLSINPINKPYMVCYHESKVMNIPVNKVQTANGNFCGSIPADFLNKEFLNLKRIALSNIHGFKNMSAHQEIPLLLENSVTHTPENMIELISKNKISYSKIISDPRFYKSIVEETADITMLIPVKDRICFLKPSVYYIRESQKSSPYRIKLMYIENDSTPKFKEACEELGVDYVFIPIDKSQSNGFFAKSLCYNIGFLIAPKTNWYIFHDLDILIDKDYFKKLGVYVSKDPKWVQPYTKKRVRLMSKSITKDLCSGKFIELSSLSEKDAVPANPGSTGGSLLVRRNVFEEIGGYDPELFYGYAPEDLFLWTKLESKEKSLGCIHSCFHNGGLYADSPAIEVYHLSHAVTELENPHHTTMRNILGSFWEYPYNNKKEIIDLKRSTLVL